MKFLITFVLFIALIISACNDDSSPTSPTGDFQGKLYYSSARKIYSYNLNDSKSVLVANNASDPFVHQQTLYAVDQASKKIVKMALDGSNRQTIIENEDTFGPKYKYWFDNIQLSPDGQLIAYSGNETENPYTYVITNDNNPELVATIGDYETDQRYISPTWDKQRNLYVQGWMSLNNGLYKIDSEFTTIERYGPNKSALQYPMVSPDGKKIAFISESKLFSMNLDGTNLIEYVINLEGIKRPFWSPDSKYVGFNSGRHIYILNTESLIYKELPKLFVEPDDQVVWTN